MSAGTGITHSEANSSKTDPVHLYQIWIMPDKSGVKPSYEQKFFSDDDKRGQLKLVASPDGSDGSVTIHQDAKLFAGIIKSGKELTHTVAAGRNAWVQVARGSIDLNGEKLVHGDGAAISGEEALTLTTSDSAEVLLFDLPE